MNIIVDYGLGNLGSVIRGFNRAGIDTKLSRDLEEIKNADSLILPGVGAFGDAMNKLNELELVDTIKDFAKTGKYMIGICLGMQIMYEQGTEYGTHKGLGLIEGSVDFLDINLKVPHMGWNDLKFEKKDDLILKYIKEDAYVITLEIGGKQLASEELADKIEQLGIQGKSQIVFIIGGSIGLGKEVLKKSNYALSFSKMTFPHQLMRVILLEQIYRSYRIINREPYHK